MNSTTHTIFFHGLTASGPEFGEIASLLTNGSISTPTMPGHGTSIDDLCRTPAVAWTAAAEAELDKTSGGVNLVGISFGAILSLYLAVNFPERVKRLVLLAPPLRFAGNIREPLFSLLSFLPERIKDNLWTTPKSGAAAEGQGYASYPAHSIGSLARMVAVRRMALKGKLLVPTMLILDPQDLHVDSRVGELLLAIYVGSEFHQFFFPEASHRLLHGPRRKEIQSLIKAWLHKS